MAWITPKTNWVDGENFDKADFNRITGNVNYLYNLYIMTGGVYFVEKNMGSAVTTYSSAVWDYTYFNNLQINIANIFAGLFGLWDPVEVFTYSDNSNFCTAYQLNYIESKCIEIYDELQHLIVGLRRIPFRLGQYKTRI